MDLASLTWRTRTGTAPGGRHGTAVLSGDRRYRLSLTRSWASAGRPRAMTWIMLNPSTADEAHDDATVRRCLGYALRERCAVLRIVNLSPLVSAHPELVVAEDFPAWWEDINAAAILDACLPGNGWDLPLVMLGWGAWGHHPGLEPLASAARRLLARHRIRAWSLGFTQSGEPVHPLRQRADAELRPAGAWPSPARRLLW